MLGSSGGLISFHMIISQLTIKAVILRITIIKSALCVSMQGVMLRNWKWFCTPLDEKGVEQERTTFQKSGEILRHLLAPLADADNDWARRLCAVRVELCCGMPLPE